MRVFYSTIGKVRDGQMGLLHDPVTSDLWCREVLLEGCSPCLGPIPRSFART
jgi:hypothetical protein